MVQRFTRNTQRLAGGASDEMMVALESRDLGIGLADGSGWRARSEKYGFCIAVRTRTTSTRSYVRPQAGIDQYR